MCCAPLLLPYLSASAVPLSFSHLSLQVPRPSSYPISLSLCKQYSHQLFNMDIASQLDIPAQTQASQLPLPSAFVSVKSAAVSVQVQPVGIAAAQMLGVAAAVAAAALLIAAARVALFH